MIRKFWWRMCVATLDFVAKDGDGDVDGVHCVDSGGLEV